jgi:hypothetical protein
MKLFFTLLFISTLYLAKGQDRLFTYTYQSNVLNTGQREIEVWNTLENGRDDYYQRLRHRAEYEIGLGGNLQTAFYLNLSQKTFFDKDINQLVKEPVEFGFSNEWKYKIFDPVANVVGLALYGEFTIEPHETELEGKIILDKQTGRFLHAVNIVVERGWEKEVESNQLITEAFTEAQLNYALAYRINPGLHVGIESILRNEWAPEHEYNNLFAGPVFSFSNEKFWINGTFLPQITSFYSADETSNGLDLNHNSKFEARVIFSFIL